MGSDIARKSFDPTRHYHSVVMQQGRVTLEADWNEAEAIFGEEVRQETLDIVGPAGSPDNGYQIQPPPASSPPPAPFDFAVSNGTAYVGGLRLSLDALEQPVLYSTQSDWLDHSGDPDWNTPEKNPGQELVYLLVREHEVSAVEDQALREVALGGPDTAQRTRMIQRFLRVAGDGTCAGGLKALEAQWSERGLIFDPKTMRLKPNPKATLKVDFGPVPMTGPCDPAAVGGYLGADNQLIRVQITGANSLVWGYDDASFLYRVTVIGDKTLQLQSQPVDAFHQPRAKQAVEVLRSAALLSPPDPAFHLPGNYVASGTGDVQTLAQAYDQDKMQITLPNALVGAYLDSNQTPQVFLRVWEQQMTFLPGVQVELGMTGLFVTLGDGPFHVGEYWLIAVRPSTPNLVYPQRFLDGPQRPDGPRMWACPLAAIEWPNGALKVEAPACLPCFDTLVDLCDRKATGCCTVSITPDQLKDGQTLQIVLDGLKNLKAAKLCLGAGTYELKQPLVLTSEHSNITIEACPGAAILSAARDAGPDADPAFLQGLIALTKASNVTLRGLTFDIPLAPYQFGLLDVEGRFDILLGVAVRPVNCAQLTIEGCAFRYIPRKAGRRERLRQRTIVAFGVLGGGICDGFRILGNDFAETLEGGAPFGFLVGFAAFPSSVFAPPPNTAGLAFFVPPRLDDALLRDNRFSGLSAPILVYSDWGLVRVESNTVRDSTDGFLFLSFTTFAATFNMWSLSIDTIHAESAIQTHNAIFSVLANPPLQTALAAARGLASPATATAQKVTPQPGAETDISRLQALFDTLLPPPPPPADPTHTYTPAAHRTRAPLSEYAAALKEHPLAEALAVPDVVTALNARFSAVENQAAATVVRTPPAPSALHVVGNDVNAQISGPGLGLGLFVLELLPEPTGAINVCNNSFITRTTLSFPADFVVGLCRCVITGNIFLNEQRSIREFGGGAESLFVFTPFGAITGNVLNGRVALFALPLPPTPFVGWNSFNSISDS